MENHYFIWHKSPTRLQLNAAQVYQVEDEQSYINTNWAKGRSQQKKRRPLQKQITVVSNVEQKE